MQTGQPVPFDVQMACQASVMSFMAHFDADEFDALQALFAPDGTWVRSDGTLRGMADLQAWIARRQPGRIFVRHLISNLRFEALPDGRVRAHSYVVAYRHDGEPGEGDERVVGIDDDGRNLGARQCLTAEECPEKRKWPPGHSEQRSTDGRSDGRGLDRCNRRYHDGSDPGGKWPVGRRRQSMVPASDDCEGDAQRRERDGA